MFITERMYRATLLLPREDEARFWDALGRFGGFQPEELREAKALRKHLSFVDLGELNSALREAANFLGIDLTEPLAGSEARPLAPDELAGEVGKLTDELAKARARLQKLRERARELERELEKLETWRAHLELLKPLGVDVGGLRSLKRFAVIPGTLPARKLPQLELSLAGLPHALIPYREEKQRLQLVAVALKRDEGKLLRILDSALFRMVELPAISGTPEQAEEALRKREAKLQAELAETEEKLREFESWRRRRRRELADFVKVNLSTLEALSRVGRTREVAMVVGWVPGRQLHLLEKIVSREERWVLESQAIPYHRDRDDYGFRVPSKLHNPPLIRAFESLVEVYGVPRYGRFDPTLVFALVFLLLFGMMFGDLGHGFILALLGASLRLWPRISRPALRRTGTILLAVGASSMVFGTLYGSLFGYENIIPALWLRPLDETGTLLSYAIMIGIGVILAGIAANLASRALGKQYRELVLERSGALGLWFYLGSLTVVGSLTRGGKLPFLQAAVLMGLPLLLMLAGELAGGGKGKPGERETGFTRTIVATVDLFETVLVYLSNSLSFVRVAAFALTHVALSLATFQLAGMLRELPGGSAVYLGAIALGNVLILILEGGIVAIQTLRLEFYEFFSKFFSEEGVRFRPFKFNLPARRRG